MSQQQQHALAPAGAGEPIKPSTSVPMFNRHLPGPPLPILSAVKCREAYRTRNAEVDMEEAVWDVPEQAECSENRKPTKVMLKSYLSTTESFIDFTNKTPFQVRALWIDFKSTEVAYATIEPNETKRYRTYVTHPWIVREQQKGACMMLNNTMAVFGTENNQKVIITAPPLLTWSFSRHRCFPEPFKQASQALLYCHKKLEKLQPYRPLPSSTACSSTEGAAGPGSGPGAIHTFPLAAPGSPYAAEGNTFSSRYHGLHEDLPTLISISASEGAQVTATVTLSPRKQGPSSKLLDLGAEPHGLRSPGKSMVSIRVVTSGERPMEATVQLGTCPAAAGPSMPGLRAAGHPLQAGAFSDGSRAPAAHMQGGWPASAAASSAFGRSEAWEASGCNGYGSCSACASYSGPSGGRQLAEKASKNCDHAGILENFLHGFKTLLSGSPQKPKRNRFGGNRPATCQVDVHMESEQLQEVTPVPSVPHLGLLPGHLLLKIVEMAAPEMYQHICLEPIARPDIEPIFMPCPPTTPQAAQEDAAAQQDQAAQPQQQQA